MKYQIEHHTITEYQPDIKKISLNDLYNVEDHSIEGINLYNVLEFENKQSLNSTIKMILSKLRLTGTASLIALDVNRLCELYLDKVLSLDEFHLLSYNKILYPGPIMIEILKENNCDIKILKTDRVVYYIEFGRKSDV